MQKDKKELQFSMEDLYNFHLFQDKEPKENNDDDIDEGATHSTCSLPCSVFDELVEGAVQMYISKYKFLLLGGNNQSRRKDDNQKQSEE